MVFKPEHLRSVVVADHLSLPPWLVFSSYLKFILVRTGPSGRTDSPKGLSRPHQIRTKDTSPDSCPKQSVLIQIRRSAGTDVPEGGLLDKDFRTQQNGFEETVDGETVEPGRFLFDQINTGSPLLSMFPSGRMNPVEPDYRQQQDVRLLREQVIENVVVGSSAVVSTGVSVGYVMWLLRGGSLLTTFLSSLPAWQAFDPLAVLESFEENEDGDQESLASLVSDSE